MDYEQLILDAVDRWESLSQQKEEIATEILKLRQFIYAAMNLLPDEKRIEFQDHFAHMAARFGGLTDAVREVLKLAAQRQTYFTAVEVRDQLIKAGFDFTDYSSNPLASVNTTIKRFKESEVEYKEIGGVAAYRWIVRFPRMARTLPGAVPGIPGAHKK